MGKKNIYALNVIFVCIHSHLDLLVIFNQHIKHKLIQADYHQCNKEWTNAP